MNLNQHPDLLEQIRKWERDLHEHTGVKVALIAYEGETNETSSGKGA